MKKILYTQGDITYEVGIGLGSWALSEEKVPIGTTRVIGGILMYAYTVYTYYIFSHSTNWVPIDKDTNEFEKLRSWRNNL